MKESHKELLLELGLNAIAIIVGLLLGMWLVSSAHANPLQDAQRRVIAKKNATCTLANPVGNCVGLNGCQNFEGAGYDNSEAWTEDSTGCVGCIIDEDYTTSPLRQTQSLRMRNGTTAGSYTYGPTFDYSEFYWFYRFTYIDIPPSDGTHWDLQAMWDSTITYGVFTWLHDAKIELRIGTSGTLYEGTTTIVEGTTYYLWGYFKKGAADAQAWIKLSTTPTIPVSNEVATTGIAFNYNMAGMLFTTLHDATDVYEYKIDQALHDSTAIGSVCP